MLERIIKRGSVGASRQARQAAREVSYQADHVAEYIANHVGANHLYDPISLCIGEPPQGVTKEEFMDRVAGRTLSILNSNEPRRGVSQISYDPDASRQATEEFEAIQPGVQPSPGAEAVRIVFHGVPEAEAA